MKLARNFYSRNTKTVAKELLGKVLVHRTGRGTLRGRIVETEAYFGSGDPASHAHCGRTQRNFPMFGTPGVAYVYFCYGNHWLFNIVASNGGPGAVLVRAVEPLEGIETMKKNRRIGELVALTNGPGKLCAALGIGKSHNGIDLAGDSLFLEDLGDKPDVVRAKRVGISRGADRLLRFYVKGSPFVSKR